MSEFAPIRTRADLETQDADEILAGYRAGMYSASEPGSDRSRAYWHGWRNAQVDSGRVPLDEAQIELAFEMYGRARMN